MELLPLSVPPLTPIARPDWWATLTISDASPWSCQCSLVAADQHSALTTQLLTAGTNAIVEASLRVLPFDGRHNQHVCGGWRSSEASPASYIGYHDLYSE
jgi:hypothetical protein